MDKTLGNVLDEYLAATLPEDQDLQSLYVYMESYQKPKMVIQTSEQSYDYTDIIFKSVDLLEQQATLQKEVKALQDKVRSLEKSKQDVARAIKLLKETT